MSYRDKCPPARRGVAAVELAIVLPFLCFLLIVAIDYARIFYFSLTVANCARNGALYATKKRKRGGNAREPRLACNLVQELRGQIEENKIV